MSNQLDHPVGLGAVTDSVKRLREASAAKTFLMVPGCVHGLSAKFIAKTGFSAAHDTDSWLSMGTIGAPDTGVISFSDVIDRTRRIADCVDVPCNCDADTGHRGPINGIRTAREFKRAGLSAIQIEDQAYPKKSSHEPVRKPAPMAEVVEINRQLTAPMLAALNETGTTRGFETEMLDHRAR